MLLLPKLGVIAIKRLGRHAATKIDVLRGLLECADWSATFELDRTSEVGGLYLGELGRLLGLDVAGGLGVDAPDAA